MSVETGVIQTRIPARLDRLPWSRFHWLIIVGLGTAWILDGLEVTIVGTVASRMTSDGSGISISSAQIGIAGAVYVTGACLGALFFGQLTDRLGRKKLFTWTLVLYLVATAATGASFSAWYFMIARFFTGAGIGGEYAAINSAIDELIPARARGRVDLIINGSYWLGSAAGSAASIALLNTAWLPKDVGWRLGFALGVILAIAVLVVRRHVPESPRWLFIHGREEEAERIVGDIEQGIEEETGESLRPAQNELTVRQRETIPFREIARVAVKTYPKRSMLAVALFVGQAFIYNGITFNLGTLMTTFYDVSSGFVPVFIILYAVANFLGPLTIGRLFDTVGRKPMISLTYLSSAVLGVVLALLFTDHTLNKWAFIGMVMATFFFASAGASAAYLTASEIFPMETRALAIAFFYAIGTAVGGIAGPLLFGDLISSGDRGNVAIAFFIGSAVMALGGIAELAWGIKAEQQQLEDVAKPLTADSDEPEQSSGEGAERDGGDDPRVHQALARAADERASAAEHLAVMHSELAAAELGDEAARRRAEEEEGIARAAELHAQADDEDARAAEAAAEADAHEDEPTGDAAAHRAYAAAERARAFREEVDDIAPSEEREGRRHRELAEAARERARAAEQRARAATVGIPQAQGDGDGDGAGAEDAGAPSNSEAARALHDARVRLHEANADLHEARAHEHEARSRQAAGEPDADVDAAARESAAAAERAQAAEAALQAAQHRLDAEHEHRGEESSQQDQERAAAEQRRREYERRVRRRMQRERQRRRSRLGLGPGRSAVGSPAISSARRSAAEVLDHEIAAIERSLAENGPTSVSDLRALVGARYWGPGVFNQALGEALAEGSVRRVARGIYGPSEQPDRQSSGQA